jgi:hypothetical protein
MIDLLILTLNKYYITKWNVQCVMIYLTQNKKCQEI